MSETGPSKHVCKMPPDSFHENGKTQSRIASYYEPCEFFLQANLQLWRKKKLSSNIFLPQSLSPPFADVNDNVPFFVSSNYEVSVPEGADVGTSVVQVLATDLDSGLHGEV